MSKCATDCTCGRHRPRQVSAETKAKIRKGRREQYCNDEPEVIDHKRCSKCKVIKPLDDFYKRKVKLKSTGKMKSYPAASCKECTHKRVAEWKERKKEEGTWKEYEQRQYDNRMNDPERHAHRLAWQREWEAQRRRKAGMKSRGPWKKYRETGKGGKLPLMPFSVWLSQQVIAKGMDKVCDLTGLDEKQVRRWTSMKDGSEYLTTISVEAADKVFVALDHPHEMAILYPIDC